MLDFLEKYEGSLALGERKHQSVPKMMVPGNKARRRVWCIRVRGPGRGEMF